MAFAVAAVVGASVAAAGGLAKLGMSLAGRKGRIEEQRKAKEAMAKRMTDYENLDTSNLNANVENKFQNQQNAFEDLTVNTKQAEFEGQQSQQSQANIMSSLSGAAGGSGIAALAQTMANEGQLQAQKSSASIGAQEAANQKLRADEASKLQYNENLGEERAETSRLQGAETARGLEYSKTGTLLGMSQQRAGAANQARAQAKAAQMGAVGDIAGAGMQMATAGIKMGAPGGGKIDAMSEEYQSTISQAGRDYLNQGPGGVNPDLVSGVNPDNTTGMVTKMVNGVATLVRAEDRYK